MAEICSICAKLSDDFEKLEIILCRECFSDTKRITIEPKVNQLQSVTRKDTARLSKSERFNFLSLTLILVGVVVCYLYSVDAHIRAIINDIYHATFGKLTIESGVVILVLVVLVVVLFLRKK